MRTNGSEETIFQREYVLFYYETETYDWARLITAVAFERSPSPLHALQVLELIQKCGSLGMRDD